MPLADTMLHIKHFHAYIRASPKKETFIKTTSRASLKNKMIFQNIYDGILFGHDKEGNPPFVAKCMYLEGQTQKDKYCIIPLI